VETPTEASERERRLPLDRRLVFSILILAFLIRISAAWVWQSQLEHDQQFFRFGDSHSYWTMAGRIAAGEPFQYGSSESKIFRAPLYPVVLAPFTLLSDGKLSWSSVMAARVLGCLLGTWTVWLIIWWSYALAGNQSALMAGLLATLYPGAIGMSIFVLSESISTPLIVLACMLLWFAASKHSRPNSNPTRGSRPGWLLYIAAGVAFGLACLARPSWSLWPLAAMGCTLIACWVGSPRTLSCRNLLCRTLSYRTLSCRNIANNSVDAISPSVDGGRPDSRRVRIANWLSGASFFVFGALLVMSPWWVRNYGITGKWVPTTLQVGASLYDGWHAGASGSSDENMDFVVPFIREQQAEDEILANQGVPLESTLEWRIDRRLKNAAIAWAIENPSDVVRLGLVKLRKTWTPFPVAREISNPAVRWSEAFGYIVIALGGLWGAWRLRRVDGAWLPLASCLYLAILHAVFIGSVRYRQPGIVLLCPLAGVGCVCILKWIFEKVYGTDSNQSERSDNRAEQAPR